MENAGFAERPEAFAALLDLTGECQPKNVWIKADRRNPLVPRSTQRFGDLHRGRASVEHEFGRLKHEYGLSPLRVRGLAKVQLHADLTCLAASRAPRGVACSAQRSAGPATRILFA